MKVKLCTIAIIFLILAISTEAVKIKHPVVIVPGLESSQIYVKFDKSKANSNPCIPANFTGEELYFFDWKLFLPQNIDCYLNNFALHYSRKTKRTYNTHGLDVFVNGFGKTNSIKTLDNYPSEYTQAPVFIKLVEALVNESYVPGVSVLGAPYDWRKAPNEMQRFYSMLTKLVQDAYIINNNTKVVVVAHSMGNQIILYWLHQRSQAWKDKYIRSYVNLAGVFAGVAKTIRTMISGDDLGLYFVNPFLVRSFTRSLPSSYFLLPPTNTVSEVLVSTPNANYTANDFNKLFADIGNTDGSAMLKNVKNLIHTLKAPNVEVHSLYGVDVPTEVGYVYTNQTIFPNGEPTIVYGNGDGAVPLKSLVAYKTWIGKQTQPIFTQELSGVSHTNMLFDPQVISYILNLALETV